MCPGTRRHRGAVEPFSTLLRCTMPLLSFLISTTWILIPSFCLFLPSSIYCRMYTRSLFCANSNRETLVAFVTFLKSTTIVEYNLQSCAHTAMMFDVKRLIQLNFALARTCNHPCASLSTGLHNICINRWEYTHLSRKG